MFPHLKRSSFASRTTGIILLASYLPACTGYHKEEAAPQQVVTTKHPDHIRVTLRDGSRIELRQPVVQGDSLVERKGQTADSLKPGAFGVTETTQAATADTTKARVAIALADIQTVEVHEVDVARTVLLVGAVGALIAAVAIAASQPMFEFKDGSSGQSSCPVVYAWNGHDWVLQSGTVAGAVARGAALTDVTSMPQAVTSNGELRLQVRNELAETDYLDAIKVLVVDHPPGFTVAPDAVGALHAVSTLAPPSEARDFAGRDVALEVAAADGRSWESAVEPRDTTGPGAPKDGIELVFLRPPQAGTARLVVDARNTSWVPFMLEQILATHGRAAHAWYDSLLTSPKAAREYRDAVVREAGLHVSIYKNGNWVPQGVVLDPGPEIAKQQVVALDLTGLDGQVVRIRLESAPSFWMVDQVAISYDPEPTLTVHELSPRAAQTAAGKDVLSLLKTADGKAWSFEPGEQADLHFPVPPAKAGMDRSYLVRTTGWYTIHVPTGAAGDYAQLQRLIREPGALARFSTATLNEALRTASAPR